MQFAHEKLTVYHKVVTFLGCADDVLKAWNRKHAFVDHFARASESILSNLVEAVRLRSGPRKQRSMDYSIGSTMECGACLDIACMKSLLDSVAARDLKRTLVEILRMNIGLRRSWEVSHVAEDRVYYGHDSGSRPDEAAFHHESLDVYKYALSFYRWLLSQDVCRSLMSPFERRIDKFATCILLNVAEGNGRFSVWEQSSFLEIANSAAAKAAAYLDLGVQKGLWSAQDISEPKTTLVHIGWMTARNDDAR